MADLYFVLGIVFGHMAIGSALMVNFMTRRSCRTWWQVMSLPEFLHLWLCFAFGWSWAVARAALEHGKESL